MEDRIMQIILGKESNEITWRSMIYELVRSEGMDPWNINVSVLSRQYMQMLKKLHELDFRVSGKMVLAAAMLLRMKSNLLVGEEMAELDRLMAPQNEEELYDEFYDGLDKAAATQGYGKDEYQPLLPRVPQPRKRKVSVYDLVLALQKALEVRDRRHARKVKWSDVEVPKRKVVMGSLITETYSRIVNRIRETGSLKFSELVPEQATKQDKVLAFMPLLHLAHSDFRKVDLSQESHFEDITILLREGGVTKRLQEANED